MISTWEQLAELRAAGRRPSLPLIVTDSARAGRNLIGVGAMTIVHESGQPMPLELLEGLDVFLLFAKCERAARVKRALDSKEITCAWMLAWCACDKALTTCCGPCADIREVDRMLAARVAA